jgi:adenine-specific DNA-methyltransferase
MVGLATKDRRPNLHFDLIDPATGINYGCPNMGWRYDRKTMSRLIDEKRILWPASPDGRPRRKAFLTDLTSEHTGVSSIIGVDVYTRDGTAEINELFGFRAMDFPKPVGLLRELIEQGADEDAIVMDFFAGSCTTAHAVFEHNLSEQQNCSFIMVQLPEKLDEESETYKKGFRTIADLGKQRIRLASKHVTSEQKDALDLAEVGKIDLGCKVFCLDRSNFNVWAGEVATEQELGQQIDMHINHLGPQSKPQDILCPPNTTK